MKYAYQTLKNIQIISNAMVYYDLVYDSTINCFQPC